MMALAVNRPPVIVAPRKSRGRIWWALLAALATGAGLGIFYHFNPADAAFFPKCQWYQLTAIYCPGCGGQRALHFLLHGDFIAAFHHNALLVLSIPLVLFYLAHQIMNRRAGSDHPPRLEIKVWLWGLLGIAISFGVLRNLPGFDWLCP